MPHIILQIKRVFIFVLLLAASSEVAAQFSVNSNSTATQYINNLVGAGVSFSNATLSGDPAAIGSFTGANASLGFTNGVILTSGNALRADTLASYNASNVNGGLTDVPSLNPFVNCPFGAPTNNGLVVEFDFIPQSSPVTFRYIFASEEYPDFVCSQYNDAFGFFISGPGISGEINLAFVPGTNDPITISTINNGNVGLAGDPFNDPCILSNSQYFNLTPPSDIVYDGYTVPLTATSVVTPCQTYHIRLMIADGCDETYDSAVFLEAGSFGSAPVSVTSNTLNSDSTIYEGCAPATFVVTKNDASLLNQAITVNFNIGGTATLGVDYTGISNSVTIPAGQLSTSLTVAALVDGIAEGSETIQVIYSVSCGLNDTLILFIRNASAMVVTPGTGAVICSGQGPVPITCSVAGGVPPYSYSWSNGGGTNAIALVSPVSPTTYTVTVTDFCGKVGFANVNVAVGQIPALPVVASVTPLCENDIISLSASTTTAGATIHWSGPNSFAFQGTTTQISPATIANSGFYIVSSRLNGCNSQNVTISVVVNPRPTPPVLSSNSPVCEGASLSLSAVVNPATATITWTGPNGFTATGLSVSIPLSALAAGGLYSATADISGCFASAAGSVLCVVNDTPDAPVVNTTSPICAGLDLTLSTSSVAPVYSWTGPQGWTAATASTTRPGVTSAMSGDYSLVLTNNGCSSVATTVNVVVFDASALPVITTNSPVCEGADINLSTPAFTGGTYFWSGPVGYSSSSQNSVINSAATTMSGIYSLYVVVGTCTTATSTSEVIVEIQPVANAGLDIQLCSQDVGQIGSPGQIGFTYSWLPIDGLSSSSTPQPSVNLNIPSGSVLQKNYILTVSSGSCSDRDTVLAEITPRPVASYLPTPQQCFNNNSFDFESNGTFASATPRFVWSFGPFATPDSSSDQNPQNVSFSSTGNQNVSLTIIDRGCVSEPFSLPLNVLPMPVSNFTASVFEGCEPMQVSFTNLSENPLGGPLNYSWNFGSFSSSELESPFMIFSNAGKFNITLTATDGAGCSNSYTIANMITVHPSPQAGFNISPSTTIDITDPVVYLTDLSTNASRCVYYIGQVDSLFQFNTSYTFQDTGYFVITQVLSTEFGCVDSAATLVRVDLGYKLFIPTSFSPNDDGLNDYFKVFGEDISSVEIVIFDRWGEQLYASYDKDNGWDGTTRLNRKKVPGGIYIYSIKVLDRYNRKFKYDGTVVVLK